MTKFVCPACGKDYTANAKEMRHRCPVTGAIETLKAVPKAEKP